MVVVITGATGAIGSAMTRLFSRTDDVIGIYAKNDQGAAILEKECGCLMIKADITDKKSAEMVIDVIIKKYGKIDLLINNAGISQIKLFTDITDEDWHNMMNISLNAMFYITKRAVPYMIKRQSGCIINISSVWGVHGASCEVHYSTAKAGIIGFTKAIAKELGPSGIRVNCIAPGVIDSPMNNNHLSEKDMEELKQQTPLQKIGAPEDVAQAAKYLSDAQFVTGQVLGVDGGFY